MSSNGHDTVELYYSLLPQTWPLTSFTFFNMASLTSSANPHTHLPYKILPISLSNQFLLQQFPLLSSLKKKDLHAKLIDLSQAFVANKSLAKWFWSSNTVDLHLSA